MCSSLGLKVKVIREGQGVSAPNAHLEGVGHVNVFKLNAQTVTSTAATERGQACGEAWQPSGSVGSSVRLTGVGVASGR